MDHVERDGGATRVRTHLHGLRNTTRREDLLGGGAIIDGEAGGRSEIGHFDVREELAVATIRHERRSGHGRGRADHEVQLYVFHRTKVTTGTVADAQRPGAIGVGDTIIEGGQRAGRREHTGHVGSSSVSSATIGESANGRGAVTGIAHVVGATTNTGEQGNRNTTRGGQAHVQVALPRVGDDQVHGSEVHVHAHHGPRCTGDLDGVVGKSGAGVVRDRTVLGTDTGIHAGQAAFPVAERKITGVVVVVQHGHVHHVSVGEGSEHIDL